MKKLVLLLAFFLSGVAVADSDYPASSLYQLTAQLTTTARQLEQAARSLDAVVSRFGGGR